MSRTESQLSYGNRVSQFGFTDMFGQTGRRDAAQPQSSVAAEQGFNRRQTGGSKKGGGKGAAGSKAAA